MDSQTLAISSQNWLETTSGSLNCTIAQLTTTNNCFPYTYGTYGYPTYYYYTSPSPARPIKLTMSEIERLRKAAKADDKIKAILAKFTDQIEITVDFD